MRILVVGAGAIGGYFGGRLVEKGEDVTFLVREKRKQQLDKHGLKINSVYGDLTIKPKTIVSGELASPFDVILFSTKAYHLNEAINSVRPYVGENTMILSLLNGIAHLDQLINEFGEEKILGGVCLIETTLDHEGNVIHKSSNNELLYGELSGKKTERMERLQDIFSETKASFRLSDTIKQDMWHKYLFITTVSGVTSLFRSPIGPIRDQEFGNQTINEVLAETIEIMKALDAPLANQIEMAILQRINRLSYEMKSSLQRDTEKQLPTEADHFFGYLLTKAKEKGIEAPALTTIYANLKIYENSIIN